MIRLLPLDQLSENQQSPEEALAQFDAIGSSDLKEITGNEYELFQSGTAAIRAIVEYLYLTWEDEVFITTTTGSSYVSTCVSATVFNYCKLSRVLTDKTKAIFVIHTYGFPHPELMSLRKTANDLNIPLIEDCISSFDSYSASGVRLGSIGDFAVYSLTKIFPFKYGGVLSFKERGIKGIDDTVLYQQLKKWLPVVPELKKKRVSIYQTLKKNISTAIYADDKNANPFMYGFNTLDFFSIQQELAAEMELGRTHVAREVHIPINPFVRLESYLKIVHRWNQK
ncbi:MAG: DegT/DnrJ/EryC1/StrS family aminotransferase [Bacteroidetes bacterium]|nr:DegT/DnrJ/EryC1/StrS family aminotransferase [Bacteroidota bacterium]